MRTTFTTMNQKILSNLNKLTSDLSRLNDSISSERQMSTTADNPPNLVSALGLRTTLTEIKQYGENLVYGSSMIDVSESALQQMKEGLMRARVLALNGINGATSTENKATMAKEIANIFDQAVTLANTQMNGKFIFGGYRTAGYNEIEPTPFIVDQADGYRVTGQNLVTLSTGLTGKMDGTGILDGDLRINDIDLGADIAATTGDTNGLYMDSALNAVTVINNMAGTGVTASLTTLYSDAAAQANPALTTASFDLNGVAISFDLPVLPDGTSVADFVATEINKYSSQTGVTAYRGDGNNGGGADSVVFQNIQAGDGSSIEVTNLDPPPPGPPDVQTIMGFGNFNSGVADIDNNTGEVTLTSDNSIVLTSPNNPTDDTILDSLGLGGGIGFADEAGDGELIYGYPLGDGDLTINGIPIGASSSDGVSTVFADASAAAKAEAINAASDQTGVTAVVTPVYRLAEGVVDAGALSSGDLYINNIDIFDYTAAIPLPDPQEEAIVAGDSDNTLLNAINARQAETHIVASRDSDGRILLTPDSADPGINLQIKTSANGESITHLNGGSPPEPQDKVYFGAVQLRSDRKFMVETTPTSPSQYEPGLAALGLDGGTAVTGEEGDTAGDGELAVASVMDQTGNVRYVGDKDNDIAIKVGKESTLEISKNGQEGVKDSGVFDALKDLENFLLGQRFTDFQSFNQATDTSALLDSGDTGLERADELVAGDFTVTVTDHATDPPGEFAIKVGIDPAVDSLDDVAEKINGIPGLTAQWSDGYLQVSVDDPDRYTVNMDADSTNFLDVVGLRQEDMQVQALSTSLTAIDDSIQELNNNISDFGARANRITIQNQIYDNLELAASDSLSKAQDTDILEALMQLKSKQTAYQAALSAAAQSMQLSLVDFL